MITAQELKDSRQQRTPPVFDLIEEMIKAHDAVGYYTCEYYVQPHDDEPAIIEHLKQHGYHAFHAEEWPREESSIGHIKISWE